MKFIAIALSLLGAAFASNAIEAAAIFKIEGADAQCQEIGEMVAPYLFQNGFDEFMKTGSTRLINAIWRIKAADSSYMTTLDHCSQLHMDQVFHVYSEVSYLSPDAKPKFTITHRAKYENVLDDFIARSESPKHVFTLSNGSIVVNPF